MLFSPFSLFESLVAFSVSLLGSGSSFIYSVRPSVHRPKKMDVGFEERYTHTRVRQIDGQRAYRPTNIDLRASKLLLLL
jgi:hypothetical protein